MAHHSLGEHAQSQAALDELIAKYGNTLGYQIAEVYAWRGERDKAVEWLERCYPRHDGGLIYVAHDRYFTPIRSDPRVQALLKKLKLPSA